MSLQVQVMVCHVITVQHDVGAVSSLVLLLYGLRYLSPTLQCTLLSPNISQPQFNRDLGNHILLSTVQSRPRLSHSPAQFNRDLGYHIHLSTVQSRPRYSHSPEHSSIET